MDEIIIILEKQLIETKASYIENSIIVHQSAEDQPVPDTDYDLRMIIEYTKAIDILKNYHEKETQIKNTRNTKRDYTRSISKLDRGSY